jgi:hypothetical protein
LTDDLISLSLIFLRKIGQKESRRHVLCL